MKKILAFALFVLLIVALFANTDDFVAGGGVARDLICAIAGCVDTSDIADNAVTSDKVSFNYAASSSEGGAATSAETGDSATAFFSSGTIEADRLPDVPLNAVTEQNETCLDSGNGSPGALTIIPNSTFIDLRNDDPQGCNVTISESGFSASAGPVYICVIVNTGGNPIVFVDQPGVLELTGTFNMSNNDCLGILYIPLAWVEISRSNSP